MGKQHWPCQANLKSKMWYNCTGVLKFLFSKSTILLNLGKKFPFSWFSLENAYKYPNSGLINRYFPDTYIATRKKTNEKLKSQRIKASSDMGKQQILTEI